MLDQLQGQRQLSCLQRGSIQVPWALLSGCPRRLTAAEGLDNVSYELGDIQNHPLAAEQFDVVISRFGTMFFDDPQSAFGNIARAMRPRAAGDAGLAVARPQ